MRTRRISAALERAIPLQLAAPTRGGDRSSSWRRHPPPGLARQLSSTLTRRRCAARLADSRQTARANAAELLTGRTRRCKGPTGRHFGNESAACLQTTSASTTGRCASRSGYASARRAWRGPLARELSVRQRAMACVRRRGHSSMEQRPGRRVAARSVISAYIFLVTRPTLSFSLYTSETYI
jgi:hypothetical protein